MFFIITTIRFLSMRRGKKRGERIGPRPKALPQASKNRVYEGAVGMVGEERLENIDVYWSFDVEKVCVGSDGVVGNCVFQL